jgi:hypothetical protein
VTERQKQRDRERNGDVKREIKRKCGTGAE